MLNNPISDGSNRILSAPGADVRVRRDTGARSQRDLVIASLLFGPTHE